MNVATNTIGNVVMIPATSFAPGIPTMIPSTVLKINGIFAMTKVSVIFTHGTTGATDPVTVNPSEIVLSEKVLVHGDSATGAASNQVKIVVVDPTFSIS